jgi:hypothetical protein
VFGLLAGYLWDSDDMIWLLCLAAAAACRQVVGQQQQQDALPCSVVAFGLFGEYQLQMFLQCVKLNIWYIVQQLWGVGLCAVMFWPLL